MSPSYSKSISMLSSGEMIGQIIFEPPDQQTAGSPPKRWVPNDQKTKKRLSLSIPIQPIEHLPITSTTSPVILPSPTMMSPTTGQRIPSPTQSSSFMVALAAQERRVLELREELERAESDLAELKREWAVREAQRKRDDARQVRQLRPLDMPLKEVEDGGGQEKMDDRVHLQKEHERRKAMSVDSRPSSHRKVIAGQRHTRALSLLSPDRLNHPQFVATSSKSSTIAAAATCDSGLQRPGATRPIPCSSRSNYSVPAANSSAEARPSAAAAITTITTTPPLQEPPNEALLRTGRQMAEGFKEGLWTFIDDLRQATVGDERGNGGRHSRKRSVHPTITSMGRSGSLIPTTSEAKNNGQQLFDSHHQPQKKNHHHHHTKAGRGKSGANDEKSVLIEVGEVFWREHGVREYYNNNNNHKKRDERNASSSSNKKEEESWISSIELDSLEEKEAWEAWGLPKTDGMVCTSTTE